MYLSDVCTIPTNLAGPRRDQRAVRHRRGRAAGRRAGAGAGAGRAGDVPGRAGAGGVGDDATARRTEYEPVIGLEVHVRAGDRHEAVLRLPQRVRRRAQHARLPGVPRAARARCRCSTSRRSSSRCGSPRRCTCDVPERVDLRPQELLLSRHAEGLPDLPVRGADHRRRLDRGRRRAHRHRARAPRGGHRQDRCTSAAAVASTKPTTRSSTTTAPACRSWRS